jgi:hypothetical protein
LSFIFSASELRPSAQHLTLDTLLARSQGHDAHKLLSKLIIVNNNNNNYYYYYYYYYSNNRSNNNITIAIVVVVVVVTQSIQHRLFGADCDLFLQGSVPL